jgi:hypothetical protein
MKPPSDSNIAKYKRIYEAVGPLRYQMAAGDCVPTTVVNALLCVTRTTLPHRLMRMIWASSLDQSNGTGWVCSKLLVELLDSWFKLSEYDGERQTLAEYTSKVRLESQVSLRQNNSLVTTLNNRGAICLTTENGGHYALLHSHDQGQRFYGFDPTWLGPRKRKKSLELLEATYGIANTQWSREELVKLLANEENQFVHLIAPRVASEA